MRRHGASCLQGPLSGNRTWWFASPEGTPSPNQESRYGKTMSASPEPLADSRNAEPPIRRELVERVRRQIAAGTYETPEKWEIALERLVQRLEEEGTA